MYACQKCQKWFKLQWLLPPHVSPCRSGCRCGIVCFTCFCASVYVSAALTRRVKIIKNQWHNTLEQRSEMACRRIAIWKLLPYRSVSVAVAQPCLSGIYTGPRQLTSVSFFVKSSQLDFTGCMRQTRGLHLSAFVSCVRRVSPAKTCASLAFPLFDKILPRDGLEALFTLTHTMLVHTSLASMCDNKIQIQSYILFGPYSKNTLKCTKSSDEKKLEMI